MEFRLAIASNCDIEMGDRILATHALKFDVVVTSEEVRAYKPNPAIFHALIKRSGVEPASILHVGDSYSYVAQARRQSVIFCQSSRSPS